MLTMIAEQAERGLDNSNSSSSSQDDSVNGTAANSATTSSFSASSSKRGWRRCGQDITYTANEYPCQVRIAKAITLTEYSTTISVYDVHNARDLYMILVYSV
jgi:hypothetical protein